MKHEGRSQIKFYSITRNDANAWATAWIRKNQNKTNHTKRNQLKPNNNKNSALPMLIQSKKNEEGDGWRPCTECPRCKRESISTGHANGVPLQTQKKKWIIHNKKNVTRHSQVTKTPLTFAVSQLKHNLNIFRHTGTRKSQQNFERTDNFSNKTKFNVLSLLFPNEEYFVSANRDLLRVLNGHVFLFAPRDPFLIRTFRIFGNDLISSFFPLH